MCEILNDMKQMSADQFELADENNLLSIDVNSVRQKNEILIHECD